MGRGEARRNRSYWLLALFLGVTLVVGCGGTDGENGGPLVNQEEPNNQ